MEQGHGVFDDEIEAEIEVKDPYQSSKPSEEEKADKLADASILKNDDSMTFTPYIAGQSKKPVQAMVEKPKMPAAREDIKNTDGKTARAMIYNNLKEGLKNNTPQEEEYEF